MHIKALYVLITLSFIVSFSILILPVDAQEPLNLTIKPDGSVEPSTDLLERNGNTYTFRGDIFGSITVRKAGITIDGAGYTLQGDPREANLRGINLVGQDETFNAYSNVLVKNLRIYNFNDGIYTPSNNNTFIGNRLEGARIHILGGSGRGNVIKHNVFVNAQIFIDYNNGGLDVITENNFIDSTIFVDLSVPPVVDRNYWSNYTAEYPEAKEADGSGVWDTPYVYDKFIGGSHGKDPCIDYHPLVNPITNFEVPNFNPFSSPPPTITSTGTPKSSTNTGCLQPIENLLLIIIITVVFAVALVLLAVFVFRRNLAELKQNSAKVHCKLEYFKKEKHVLFQSTDACVPNKSCIEKCSK